MGQRKTETTLAASDFVARGQLNCDEKLAWLRLIRSENVGPITFQELLAHYGDAQTALEALPELGRRGGMRRPGRPCTEADAIREMELAERVGVRLLAAVEADYPHLLKHVEAPPPILYAKGVVELAARRTVAIVGSRSASSAGRQFAGDLARDLGNAGVTIASGLARGIDTAAHKAALATGTIAVVAGGIDVIYPPENAELHAAIAEDGLLLAESPIGFVPRGQDFPRRNRIISGVSAGVVVVEAAQQSGSLITARTALEQNREVFAVPGHPLDPRAIGTNELIRKGAHLVTCAADIMSELPPDDYGRCMREPAGNAPRAPALRSSAGEPSPSDRKTLLEALSFTPMHTDVVLRNSGLCPRSFAIALLELDLAGRIERHGNQFISLRSRSGEAA